MCPAFIFQDGKKYEIPKRTPNQLKKIFAPYGAALGYVAVTWNQLQDQLACLFSTIFVPVEERSVARNSTYYRMAMAVWHSSVSDHAQREMLRKVIAEAKSITTEQCKAIEKALNEIDASLRHRRNSAIHAPLTFTTGVFENAVQTIMMPDVFSYSPHAKKLGESLSKRGGIPSGRKDKLIYELNWYASIANELSIYICKVRLSIENPSIHTLPDKLSLPPAPPVKTRKPSRRQTHPKAPQRQLRSSRA